jgi:hypothetical protein
MKASEVLSKLNAGSKLIYADRGYARTVYYIDSEDVNNRLTVTQFEKYKLLCKHFDDNEKSRAWFRGQSYNIYYWL